MGRIEALTNYYTAHNEDARLTSKHGMVEFLTTIHYVEKYLKPGMRILEIGAGTGRYSHYFAQKGYVWMQFIYPHSPTFSNLMLCFTVSWTLNMLLYSVFFTFVYIRYTKKGIYKKI